MDISTSTALVTGANRGLGRRFALELLARLLELARGLLLELAGADSDTWEMTVSLAGTAGGGVWEGGGGTDLERA